MILKKKGRAFRIPGGRPVVTRVEGATVRPWVLKRPGREAGAGARPRWAGCPEPGAGSQDGRQGAGRAGSVIAGTWKRLRHPAVGTATDPGAGPCFGTAHSSWGRG